MPKKHSTRSNPKKQARTGYAEQDYRRKLKFLKSHDIYAPELPSRWKIKDLSAHQKRQINERFGQFQEVAEHPKAYAYVKPSRTVSAHRRKMFERDIRATETLRSQKGLFVKKDTAVETVALKYDRDLNKFAVVERGRVAKPGKPVRRFEREHYIGTVDEVSALMQRIRDKKSTRDAVKHLRQNERLYYMLQGHHIFENAYEDLSEMLKYIERYSETVKGRPRGEASREWFLHHITIFRQWDDIDVQQANAEQAYKLTPRKGRLPIQFEED